MSSDQTIQDVPMNADADQNVIHKNIQAQETAPKTYRTPWQCTPTLDKNFKPWPGLLYVCNVAVKFGIQALPFDVRPTIYYLSDELIDRIHNAPFVIGNTVGDFLDDFKFNHSNRKNTPHKNDAKNDTATPS